MPIKFKPGLSSFIYKGKLISKEEVLKDQSLIDELTAIGANIFDNETEKPPTPVKGSTTKNPKKPR